MKREFVAVRLLFFFEFRYIKNGFLAFFSLYTRTLGYVCFFRGFFARPRFLSLSVYLVVFGAECRLVW